MKWLEGKVAVVTGGSSRLGFATAKMLTEHGAKVAIAGRDATRLKATAESLGTSTIAVHCDVRVHAEVARLFAVVHETFGKIDILFVDASFAAFASSNGVRETCGKMRDFGTTGTLCGLKEATPHLNAGAALVLNANYADAIGVPGNAAVTAGETTAALIAAYALVAKLGVGGSG